MIALRRGDLPPATEGRTCTARPRTATNCLAKVARSAHCMQPLANQALPSALTFAMSVAQQTDTRTLLERFLSERILVLDGAMGTMVQALKFSEADFRGHAVRRPSAGPARLHRRSVDHAARGDRAASTAQYLEAGADIIETNTFNANAISMADYRLAAATCARSTWPPRPAPAGRSTSSAGARPQRPRFVAGSIGPTNRAAVDVAGNVERSRLSRGHVRRDGRQRTTSRWRRWSRAASISSLPETAFDTLNLKACLFAIEKYFDEHGVRLPVMASVTIFQGRPHAFGPDGRGLLELDRARRSAQRGHQLRAGAGA